MVRPTEQTNEEWLRDYEQHNTGESMMDMSQYSTSDSKDLKAKDFVGKNLKVKISGVTVRDYPATDDHAASSKPVLSFEGKEKTLVLNATNTKTLCDAYGADSDGWVNREIGLTVADYTDKNFGYGWVVKALDVPEPEFDDAIPF